MKLGTISQKILLAVSLFGLIVTISISVMISRMFVNREMEGYRSRSYALARTASDLIDGDQVLRYVETLEKDEYYESVQKYFDYSRQEIGMEYYYVFVPYEDDLVYVWDGVTEEPSQLGDREEYMNEYSRKAVQEEFVEDPPQILYETESEVYGHIVTAYYPIYTSAHKPVAVVGVDYQVADIRRTLNRVVWIIVLIIALVTLIANVLFYIYIRSGIVDPVRELNGAAKEMVHGLDQEKEIVIDVHTGDELEELAGSFNEMYRDVQNYIDRIAEMRSEKERIETELDVATAIQMDMLPKTFPHRKEIKVYASTKPARQVGGDFYDYFMIDDDHMGLVIADVSGKGVPAALFMVISKILIKIHAMEGGSPSEVLNAANRDLCGDNDAGMFVTVWFAILELSTGILRPANAGHEHPVVRLQSEKKYKTVEYRHSPVLGVFEEMKCGENCSRLNPGDRVFVYTDGVTEAANSKDERYGMKRLVDTLNSHEAEKPKDVLAVVQNSIDEFSGDAEQFDDITMLCFDYFGCEKDAEAELQA